MTRVYLQEHLNKYPSMQIEDVLKLLFQGILGPGHLIADKDKIKKKLIEEYQTTIHSKIKYPLIEKISDSFVRIYLKPYYEKTHSFDSLVEAFYFSTLEKVSIKEFIENVRAIKNEQNAKYIENYLKSGDFLISHSLAYKKEYEPHYLVIHVKFLDDLFLE